MTQRDGHTFVAARDEVRLDTQHYAILGLALSADTFWTPPEIKETLGFDTAPATARLRDFRKVIHGGYAVTEEFVERGLHRYRVRYSAHELKVVMMGGKVLRVQNDDGLRIPFTVEYIGPRHSIEEHRP